MRTLAIDPSYPVTRRMVAPVRRSEQGGPNITLRRKTDLPFYEFSISLPLEDELTFESLDALLAEVQGDTPFWFDGSRFAEVRNPRQIGIGDASRTDFYLPFRNVFANSCILKINGVINSAWTMVESTGLVNFTSAPAANAQIALTAARMRYKVVAWYGDTYLYEPALIYNQIYNNGELTLREVP